MNSEAPTVSTSDEKLPLGGISSVNKWLSPNDLHADQIFDEVIGEMLNPRLNSPLSKTAKKIVRQVKLDGYRDYRPQSRTLVMNLPEVIYYDDGYRDNFSRRLRDAIRELGYGNYFKSFDYHPHQSRKAKVTDEQTFEFQSHTLAEVEAEEIEYLVKGYIPLGMLTYLGNKLLDSSTEKSNDGPSEDKPCIVLAAGSTGVYLAVLNILWPVYFRARRASCLL